jgi:hypothetical protein
VNKAYIQEIDATSQQNPKTTTCMYKISTVAADINYTSPNYTCHDIKIHHHINPPNPDKWVNLNNKINPAKV